MHLISQSGNKLNDNEILAISKMMKGFKKNIVKEISEKNLCVVEGREHMIFKCYQKTFLLLIEDGSPDSIFALCFSTMQWNLKSHSEAKESISFGQLKWENDHVKVYFSKHKSDQIGLNKDEARHIYSNPKDPVVCPIQV